MVQNKVFMSWALFCRWHDIIHGKPEILPKTIKLINEFNNSNGTKQINKPIHSAYHGPSTPISLLGGAPLRWGWVPGTFASPSIFLKMRELLWASDICLAQVLRSCRCAKGQLSPGSLSEPPGESLDLPWLHPIQKKDLDHRLPISMVLSHEGSDSFTIWVHIHPGNESPGWIWAHIACIWGPIPGQQLPYLWKSCPLPPAGCCGYSGMWWVKVVPTVVWFPTCAVLGM